MRENLNPFNNSITSKIVFFMSIFVSGYWWLVQVIDVYNYILIGAIYEILWFPAGILLYTLPIVSLILLVMEKINIRSLNIYSILIGVATILCVISA